MRASIVRIVIAACLVLGSGTAAAQMGHGGHGGESPGRGLQGGGPAGVPAWVQQLPPEQQDVVRKTMEARHSELFPVLMRIRAVQAQLVAELSAEQVNTKAVDQLVGSLNELRTRVDRTRVQTVLELKQQGIPVDRLIHHIMERGVFGGEAGGGHGGGGGMCPMMRGHGGGHGGGPGGGATGGTGALGSGAGGHEGH
jgi:Spy/CpxP family protein refolding chaperone